MSLPPHMLAEVEAAQRRAGAAAAQRPRDLGPSVAVAGVASGASRAAGAAGAAGSVAVAGDSAWFPRDAAAAWRYDENEDPHGRLRHRGLADSGWDDAVGRPDSRTPGCGFLDDGSDRPASGGGPGRQSPWQLDNWHRGEMAGAGVAAHYREERRYRQRTWQNLYGHHAGGYGSGGPYDLPDSEEYDLRRGYQAGMRGGGRQGRDGWQDNHAGGGDSSPTAMPAATAVGRMSLGFGAHISEFFGFITSRGRRQAARLVGDLCSRLPPAGDTTPDKRAACELLTMWLLEEDAVKHALVLMNAAWHSRALIKQLDASVSRSRAASEPLPATALADEAATGVKLMLLLVRLEGFTEASDGRAPRVTREIVRAGGIQLLCAVLRAPPSCQSFPSASDECTCEALLVLDAIATQQLHDAELTHVQSIILHGGVDAMARLLLDHPASVSYRIGAALSAILPKLIATNPAVGRVIHETGGIPALVRILTAAEQRGDALGTRRVLWCLRALIACTIVPAQADEGSRSGSTTGGTQIDAASWSAEPGERDRAAQADAVAARRAADMGAAGVVQALTRIISTHVPTKRRSLVKDDEEFLAFACMCLVRALCAHSSALPTAARVSLVPTLVGYIQVAPGGYCSHSAAVAALCRLACHSETVGAIRRMSGAVESLKSAVLNVAVDEATRRRALDCLLRESTGTGGEHRAASETDSPVRDSASNDLDSWNLSESPVVSPSAGSPDSEPQTVPSAQ